MQQCFFQQIKGQKAGIQLWFRPWPENLVRAGCRVQKSRSHSMQEMSSGVYLAQPRFGNLSLTNLASCDLPDAGANSQYPVPCLFYFLATLQLSRTQIPDEQVR